MKMQKWRAPVAGLVVAALATFCPIGGPGRASAAARKALIDASTVSGSPSQEETIATNLGFAVTVVPDSTWATMTAADFAQYDLLIAGDPTCGTLPPGLVSSASTFGPVVLGKAGGRTAAGNRTIVGTDPVLHDGGDFTSANARGTVIRDGIGFASAQPGTTGMYFDTTCAANYFAQSAETISILSSISGGSGAWTLDSVPPCGGSVSLIAANPAFTDLTTTSLQGWGCSVHESFPTFPSDFSALAVATDTATKPTCGVDPGTGLNACGEAYVLVAGSAIVVRSLVISLSPADSTKTAGTTQTLTANVHAAGGTPVVAGQKVNFAVTGTNAGAVGTCVPASCVSDANGNVTFTYTDAGGVGDDTVKASFTDSVGALQTATAQVHWVAGTTDTTPPACALTGVIAGPPKKIQITVGDTGSGLKSVKVTTATNATVAIPAFTPGTTASLVVTATKTNQALAADIALQVTDQAGNVTNCDPVLTTVSKGDDSAQTYTGIAQSESKILISNGTPGLRTLVVTANGTRFVVSLTSGETTELDVSSAMRPGTANKIRLRGRGPKGATADVVIHD